MSASFAHERHSEPLVIVRITQPEFRAHRLALAEHDILIGRGMQNTLCIEKALISAAHAHFWIDGGDFWIEDLNSSNGTALNNVRFKGSVRFTSKDLVTLANQTSLQFAMTGDTAHAGLPGLSLSKASALLRGGAEGIREWNRISRESHELPWLATIDFSKCDLRGAQLDGLQLCGVNMEGADLTGANLDGSDLQYAKLNGATLDGATFRRSNLMRLEATDASLVDADLTDACTKMMDWRGCYINGTTISRSGWSPEIVRQLALSANIEEHALPPPPSVPQVMSWATKLPPDMRGTLMLPRGVDDSRPDSLGYHTKKFDLLDELTTKREHADRNEPESERDERQAKISSLVNELNAEAPSPKIGDIVCGARLVTSVGWGNFGQVYEATDVTTNERVAVKIFHLDMKGMGTTLHFFRRGVEAMLHLNKKFDRPESVIRLRDVHPSRLAFSMDYMERIDLSKSRDKWTTEARIALWRELCEAVRFSHRAQILHRDIKPANVLLRLDGRPVLADFDICDILFKKTMSAKAVGTLVYAPPEQLQNRGNREYNADIYSLGKLLEFLLLGHDPPFAVEPVPVLRDLEDAPLGLQRIVRKCTMLEPRLRYQSVDALLADLSKAESYPLEVGIGKGDSVAKRPNEPRSWGIPVAIIVAIISAVSAVAVAYIGTSPKGGLSISAAASLPDPLNRSQEGPATRRQHAWLQQSVRTRHDEITPLLPVKIEEDGDKTLVDVGPFRCTVEFDALYGNPSRVNRCSSSSTASMKNSTVELKCREESDQIACSGSYWLSGDAGSPRKTVLELVLDK